MRARRRRAARAAEPLRWDAARSPRRQGRAAARGARARLLAARAAACEEEYRPRPGRRHPLREGSRPAAPGSAGPTRVVSVALGPALHRGAAQRRGSRRIVRARLPPHLLPPAVTQRLGRLVVHSEVFLAHGNDVLPRAVASGGRCLRCRRALPAPEVELSHLGDADRHAHAPRVATKPVAPPSLAPLQPTNCPPAAAARRGLHPPVLSPPWAA